MIMIFGTLVWNDNVSRGLFHFFKILIFWVVRGVKGQKTVQNNKKFCLSCSIFQEPYIIWLSFMVFLCKIIISPGGFFSFSKSWFFGLLEGGGMGGCKSAKNGPKWEKLLSIALHISGTMHHMIVTCGIYLQVFSHLFKILIFWVVRWIKG